MNDLMNTIHCGDCVDVMRQLLPDESIDLIVTSPPYDNLRSYNGYEFDFESIALELYRVTKAGGVVVWVVGDATVESLLCLRIGVTGIRSSTCSCSARGGPRPSTLYCRSYVQEPGELMSAAQLINKTERLAG